MSVTYPLRVFFDCSTAHLSPASRAYLESGDTQGDLAAATAYGWFVWADDTPDAAMPADLAAIIAHARQCGAEYVLFDRDAPEHPAFPVFEDPR